MSTSTRDQRDHQDGQQRDRSWEHPELDPKTDAEQRGDDPVDPIGANPKPTEYPDPDPGWQPDRDAPGRWRAIMGEIAKEHRPRREDVYPYLLIRALASGDRGQRPLWPPTVFWESPDILLMDADDAGPFDPSRLVVNPTAGRKYRVFVRVWNLGLVEAVGCRARAWAVDAGFIGGGNPDDPYFVDHRVGTAWLDLADRKQPGCTALVELKGLFEPDGSDVGHRCMIAEVSCPLDQSGALLANLNRHVAQRNLTVLSGPAPMKQLLGHLGELVPEGHALQLTHAAGQIGGVLTAIGGGVLPGPKGEPVPIRTPEVEKIPFGVRVGDTAHLLTLLNEGGGRMVVVPTRSLVEQTQGASLERGAVELIHQLGPDIWERAGWLRDGGAADALLDGLIRTLDLTELDAGSVASRLGGEGLQHGLRFALSDSEGQGVGGYTVVVS